MNQRLRLCALSILLLVLLFGFVFWVHGQSTDAWAGKVNWHDVDVYSEGTRISGTVFRPVSKTDERLPAIVMGHGWGGVRSHLNTAYAPYFAAEGYVVLTIDYRGWGDSDSKLVIQGKMPEPDEAGMVNVRAKAIRELVDPFDQTADLGNAIDFIVGETGVDSARIGLWGSSYSGGHVVYVAAHDPRVKCIVSQVGSQDSAGMAEILFADRGGLAYPRTQATERARGKIDPIPQGADIIPGLRGTPFLSKVVKYRPVEYAARVNAATLLIDAENEELFDIRQNSGRVYQIMRSRGKAEVQYVVVKGIAHYGIYREKLSEARQLAIDWFNKHLR